MPNSTKINKQFYKYTILLCFVMYSACSMGIDHQNKELDINYFDDLFSNFEPIFNNSDQNTVLLGHAASVNVPNYNNWCMYQGYDNIYNKNIIDSRSLFRIGSTTKIFTAALILQLYEKGLIDLDAPFNKYLNLDEELYNNIGEFAGVTIRHLLRHRSGIPRLSSTSFFDTYFYTDSIDQMNRMRYIFSDGLPEFEPGSQYAYRNSNFNILGLIIELVTGKEYHRALREEIYEKIGLTNTYLLDFDINANNEKLCHGYAHSFDGLSYHGSQAWAAGGLVSNVNDLSIFMRALVSGDLFINKKTFELMTTTVDGGHYGHGIFVNETEKGISYNHGGAIFGYYTKLDYFIEKDVIIANTMSFNGYDYFVTNYYEDFCFPIIDSIRMK